MEINSKEEADMILKEMRRLEKEILKEKEKTEEEILNIVKKFKKMEAEKWKKKNLK